MCLAAPEPRQATNKKYILLYLATKKPHRSKNRKCIFVKLHKTIFLFTLKIRDFPQKFDIS